MDLVETAGQEVLQSFGRFLDTTGAHFYQMRRNMKGGSKNLQNIISLQVVTEDHSFLRDKVETDRSVDNKILVVFAAVCNEVRQLRRELFCNFVPKIIHYGEGCSEKTSREEVQILICQFLPLLLDISNYVNRCRHTLNHFLRQLLCYFDFSKSTSSTSYSSHQLPEMISALGDLLLIFVILDSSFEHKNENIIKEHLLILEKTVNSVQLDSVGDDEPIKTLKTFITAVHNSLLNGNIFQVSLNMHIEKGNALGNCSLFKAHLNSYLKHRILEVDSAKENDVNALLLWSKVVVVYAFGVNVFGIADKKNYKLITECSKKCVIVPLCSDVMWLPSDFLKKHLEMKIRENMTRLSFNDQSLIKIMELAETNLVRDLKVYTFKVYKWSLQMENILSPDAIYIKLNDLDTANLCIEGLEISKQIKFAMNPITYLHSSLGRPMTKVIAISLCKLMELTNVVQSVFTRHHIAIAKRINHIIQRILIQLLGFVVKAKKDIINEKNCRDSQIDLYSALDLVEKLLYGACVEENLQLARLALAVLDPESFLDKYPDGSATIRKLITNLQTICVLENEIEETNDLNFIFNETHILPIYFKHIVESKSNLSRAQYILNVPKQLVFNDSSVNKIFSQTKPLLKIQVMELLCQDVETYLRIHAHSHLHLQQDSSVFQVDKDLRSLLRLPTLTVMNHFLNIRGYVESYLDKTFYDLATVALHDWQTYREMRNLAGHIFKIKTVEDNLPSQTLAQGSDILEIMRNIHIFVNRYLYNLNNQFFIESNSNNKHLNAIKINQIANSIWTHGTGVMNTTINFIYQFLRKKMVVFSKFLYDDTISSLLMKDLNHFNEMKNQHQSLYPYDRAQKFGKNMSRLGSTADGVTFLDQYRLLITQIGNALGYVRMVRTGGVHHCLEISSYLPQLDCGFFPKEHLRPAGTEVVDCFDQVLHNLVHNLTEGTEYFKLLLDVFSSVFNTHENRHLKLFFVIVPPLTINYINHIVTAKEKMAKKNRDGLVFTDDGFAIGIAYLLSVLDINTEFDALHWFDSVNKKYEQDELSILKEEELDDNTNDENTRKLFIRRLQLYKQEFELLRYNLDSARVFF